MANHYYGITVPGATLGRGAVSTGTSTTSKNVELVILDGVTGNSKAEVLKAIEAIKAHIESNDAPA